MEGRDSKPPHQGSAGLAVRAAKPSDADGIAALWALPGYRAGILRLPFENPAKASRLPEILDENRVLTVAELRGRLVGTAGWNRPTRAGRVHTAGIGTGVHDDHVG